MESKGIVLARKTAETIVVKQRDKCWHYIPSQSKAARLLLTILAVAPTSCRLVNHSILSPEQPRVPHLNITETITHQTTQ